MNDLYLDPLTNDLAVIGIDLHVVTGAERVKQQLLVKLRLWVGEWFLDTEFGTPYIERILGKQITLGGAIAALKESILEVSDVQAITSFNYNFDRQQRKLPIDFEANTPFGLVKVNT